MAIELGTLSLVRGLLHSMSLFTLSVSLSYEIVLWTMGTAPYISQWLTRTYEILYSPTQDKSTIIKLLPFWNLSSMIDNTLDWFHTLCPVSLRNRVEPTCQLYLFCLLMLLTFTKIFNATTSHTPSADGWRRTALCSCDYCFCHYYFLGYLNRHRLRRSRVNFSRILSLSRKPLCLRGVRLAHVHFT